MRIHFLRFCQIFHGRCLNIPQKHPTSYIIIWIDVIFTVTVAAEMKEILSPYFKYWSLKHHKLGLACPTNLINGINLCWCQLSLARMTEGGGGWPGKPERVQSNADSCLSFASSFLILAPPDLSQEMLISSHIGQIFLFTVFHCLCLLHCSMATWSMWRREGAARDIYNSEPLTRVAGVTWL